MLRHVLASSFQIIYFWRYDTLGFFLYNLDIKKIHYSILFMLFTLSLLDHMFKLDVHGGNLEEATVLTAPLLQYTLVN